MHKMIAAFGIVLFIIVSGVHGNDEDYRKTYQVRYWSRDVTIPVTVVLDYKKQAEYVISTNPRTPTKSVTFYDFTQRTIVYKDMTNGECFIGRLTNESLEEENVLLSNIKSPVHVPPTMLNLIPSRPSLTPTEVRNLAGQKVAMFCRKMTTWLLQQQSGNKRHRRQVDQQNQEKRHQNYSPRYSHTPPNYQRHHYQLGDRINNRHSPLFVPHQERGPSPQFYSHSLYKDNSPVAKEFSFPISSSVKIDNPPPNTDTITFHRRSDSNLHHRGKNHHRDRFLDPSLYNSRLDNYTFDLRHSFSNVNPYKHPLHGNDFTRHSPRHFQYTHQLRSGAHSNPNLIIPSTVEKSPRVRTDSNIQVAIQQHPLRRSKPSLHAPDHGSSKPLKSSVVFDSNKSKTSDDANVTGGTSSDEEKLSERDSGPKVSQSHLQKALLDAVTGRDVNHNPPHFKLAINEEAFFVDPNVRFNDSRDLSSKDHRSDIPEETVAFLPSPVPTESGQTRLHHIPNPKNYSIPNITIHEEIPLQERFQNPFQLFSPDEIVIDIGTIPNPELPSTRFHKSEGPHIRLDDENRTSVDVVTDYHDVYELTPRPTVHPSNRNVPLSTENFVHHQRHRRKKLKKSQRCCSRSNGTPKSCCTAKDPYRSPCCNSRRISNRPRPQFQTHRRNLSSTEDLCDIRKMCRTLYRSTEAVKICKIKDIPGC